MDTLTVDCAGSPGCSLSAQAAVWMCGGSLRSVVCPTGERLLCDPPASGWSGMCWHPASLAEDHIAAPHFFSSWLTDARCLCCYGRQKKGTVSQWKLKHKMLWKSIIQPLSDHKHSLLWYLRCRICESSISRWASRMDCCCEDKPVLEMVQTKASVTESSSLRTFPRLSTSSGVCGKLEQLSVNKHTREVNHNIWYGLRENG